MSNEEIKQEEKGIELPEYILAEAKSKYFKQTVSIFDLNLNDLIFEKMFLLFEKLQIIQRKHDEAKVILQVKKDELLLNTDFKTELNESRPTVAMKEAYMKPKLQEYEDNVNKYYAEIQYYKDKLNVVNDLIKSQRVLLEIEGALTE